MVPILPTDREDTILRKHCPQCMANGKSPCTGHRNPVAPEDQIGNKDYYFHAKISAVLGE